MKKTFAAAFLLALVVVGPGQTQQGDDITFAQALTVAQQGTQGLTLLYGRPETKGGVKGKLWGFYFVYPDGTIWEREVSGTTKSVIFEKQVKSITKKAKIDPKVVETINNRVLTKLPNQRYVEVAEGKGGGLAEEFEISLNGDKLQVLVSGNKNGGSWQVTLDMTTGKVLQSK